MKEIKFDRLTGEEKATLAKALAKFQEGTDTYVVAIAEVHPSVTDQAAQIAVTVRSINTGKTEPFLSENLTDWIQKFHDHLKKNGDF